MKLRPVSVQLLNKGQDKIIDKTPPLRRVFSRKEFALCIALVYMFLMDAIRSIEITFDKPEEAQPLDGQCAVYDLETSLQLEAAVEDPSLLPFADNSLTIRINRDFSLTLAFKNAAQEQGQAQEEKEFIFRLDDRYKQEWQDYIVAILGPSIISSSLSKEGERAVLSRQEYSRVYAHNALGRALKKSIRDELGIVFAQESAHPRIELAPYLRFIALICDYNYSLIQKRYLEPEKRF